jgi:hypothetical protein
MNAGFPPKLAAWANAPAKSAAGPLLYEVVAIFGSRKRRPAVAFCGRAKPFSGAAFVKNYNTFALIRQTNALTAA